MTVLRLRSGIVVVVAGAGAAAVARALLRDGSVTVGPGEQVLEVDGAPAWQHVVRIRACYVPEPVVVCHSPLARDRGKGARRRGRADRWGAGSR